MKDSRPRSVPQTPSGVTVAASPFNEVKLELGIILILMVIIWFLVESLVDSLGLQLILLFASGLAGMFRLIHRVRVTAKRQLEQAKPSDEVR